MPQVSPINEEEVIAPLSIMLFTYVSGDFLMKYSIRGPLVQAC